MAFPGKYARARPGAASGLRMDDQIEREVARKLAEHYARQEARERAINARGSRWRTELARRQDAQAERQAQREHRCGAKTRAGHSCQRRGIGAGGRCRNHGGMSTGPRTEEGRRRIADAQRRRWALRKNSALYEQSEPTFGA